MTSVLAVSQANPYNRVIPKDALTAACRKRDISEVEKAIQEGATPDENTLSEACDTGNVAIVKRVLVLKAMPNSETLTIACLSKNLEIVQLAIESKAEPGVVTQQDGGGGTDSINTLSAACMSKQIEMVDRVLAIGAKPQEGDEQGIWDPGYCYPDRTRDTLAESIESGDLLIFEKIFALGVPATPHTLLAACCLGNLDVFDRVFARCAKHRVYDLSEALECAFSGKNMMIFDKLLTHLLPNSNLSERAQILIKTLDEISRASYLSRLLPIIVERCRILGDNAIVAHGERLIQANTPQESSWRCSTQ